MVLDKDWSENLGCVMSMVPLSPSHRLGNDERNYQSEKVGFYNIIGRSGLY